MKRHLPDSPAKLALLSVLCILIVCMFFLIPESGRDQSPLFGAYLLFGIVVVPTCGILPLKFVTDLRHGVQNERWTEAQLEPLRAWFESPYYKVLSIGLLVASFIFEFALKRFFAGWGWAIFLFFLLVLYQFRFALKRPPSSTPPNQMA